MSSTKKKSLDRISHLPDSVLHSILSLLDIRQVVQTCALSKRWKTLWTDIPTLNFDFDSHPFEEPIITIHRCSKRRNSFTRFVLRVLSEYCCKDIQKMRYFSTESENISTDSVVELLTCYAQTHKVQQLCFDTKNVAYSNWPCSLNTRFDLSELKIKCRLVRNWGTLKLPSLRVLEIERVWEYPTLEEECNGVGMLSGCPNLRSLVLIGFRFETASISPPKLENFELSVDPSTIAIFPHIELLSSRLVRVEFSNVLPTLKLGSVSLRPRELHIEVEQLHNQTATTNFTELLRLFRNALSFTLPLKAIEVIMSAPPSLTGIWFSNLRYLKLKTKESKTMIVIHLPNTILSFLQRCSSLKTLAIGSN